MKHGLYCRGECYYRPNCLVHSISALTFPFRLKLQEVRH